MACHQIDKKLVGPAYLDVAQKYAGDVNAFRTLTVKVKEGGGGVWAAIPMPPNVAVVDADIKTLVKWVLSGCRTDHGGPVSVSGSSSPISVTGLTNGLNYTCTVNATNLYGTGPDSTGVTRLVEWRANLAPIQLLLGD